MRLLIIEDEKDIADPVAEVFEQEGFVVDRSYNGAHGIKLAKINNYDCILLDLNLPGVDGLECAKQLRKDKNNTPIIMVTARSQMYDKLEGFDSGADDYVTKPFELKELIARVNSVIRRNSANKSDVLSFGKYNLYPEQNKVEVKNKRSVREIILSNKETAILEYLIRNKGRIISTEELLEHVWGSGVDEFTDTVKTHIKTLRKKIDKEKKEISTVRGKGYMIK